MPLIDAQGPVLLPGQDGYDSERQGFNRIVDHRPAVIVAAETAEDVRQAVLHAAARDLPVAVQATGHGPVLPADGAVLIGTRRMNGVRIDPGARTARIEAGVRWGRVVERAAKYGLAPLNGTSPGVGAVSYTLGGGLPVLGRTYGWAVDHVRSIDVVTADGRALTATPDRHEDLFWALRGGKGNFGAVTALEIGLVPLTHVYGGGLYYPGDRAAEVVHAWREWTLDLPEETNSSVALVRFPDLPSIPGHLRGRAFTHVRVVHTGPETRPPATLGPPVMGAIGVQPYTEVASIFDEPAGPVRTQDHSMMLRDLPAEAVDTLIAHTGGDAGPVVVELRQLGGALGRTGAVPSATGHRDATHALTTVSPGPVGPARALLAAMRPWGTGRALINLFNGPDTAGDAREAYDPETYRRLVALKGVHDPANLFRINHNVPPENWNASRPAPR
ncbi:FAD-dependent oxygenase [Spongiactinospora rosea]|uniref:FAD-dependent oxygenase n=1 Tax=Spongiactinospora rosea TaxID=2248750 RepID=A0A366LLB7_9ACTN|nr:FAD-dependent oxidoreductase [Spongiactinospora rosea]RBQ14219.1 FAD-dependent oxygenase [Spongiactinospora rosea]